MKKRDVIVFWLDGTKTTFPAVRIKSMIINDEKGKVATLGFKFGKNGHVAAINLDNIKFFEVTKTCTEE